MMMCLSLWQPWASAIALGRKRIETRHWSTRYRGPLLIHAAKRWTAEEREFVADMIDDGFLPPDFVLPPPLGALVAVSRLVDVRPTEQAVRTLAADERVWGNYAEGRFAWILDDVVALPEPIALKGAQGLFDVPANVLSGGAIPPELMPAVKPPPAPPAPSPQPDLFAGLL